MISNNKEIESASEIEGGELLINRYINQVNKVSTEIKPYLVDDSAHLLKRRCSFDLLDCALDCCSSGKCPPFTTEEHQMLVDISLDCYINERVWYYGEQHFGVDDNERKKIVYGRITKVLDCKGPASFEADLFNYDYNILKFNYHLFQRALHRKAYWAYLCNPERSHLENFKIGSAIVNQTIKLHGSNGSLTFLELSDWIKDVKENLSVCSGLDLFRTCFLRRSLTAGAGVL